MSTSSTIPPQGNALLDLYWEHAYDFARPYLTQALEAQNWQAYEEISYSLGRKGYDQALDALNFGEFAKAKEYADKTGESEPYDIMYEYAAAHNQRYQTFLRKTFTPWETTAEQIALERKLDLLDGPEFATMLIQGIVDGVLSARSAAYYVTKRHGRILEYVSIYFLAPTTDQATKRMLDFASYGDFGATVRQVVYLIVGPGHNLSYTPDLTLFGGAIDMARAQTISSSRAAGPGNPYSRWYPLRVRDPHGLIGDIQLYNL